MSTTTRRVTTITRRLVTLAGSLALLAPAAVAGASPAARTARSLAPGASCPGAYPVSAVRPGLTATGWTTSRGSTPQPFAVRVLGVLQDAIAPGVDMILIRADSPAIRAAGGTWEGMSGSPIYTADGRLLGALSYGLSRGPSHTAGVTPAAAMYDLLSMPIGAHARTVNSRVTLRPQLRAAVVRSGAASAAQAEGGLRPLPVPVTVSGVPAGRLAPVATWLRRAGATGFSLHSGGGVAAGAVAPSPHIRPGAPFAVALSTGDVTMAAIGTVTAVCGGRIIGFGHPFTSSGPSGATAQRATVLYVQRDSLGSPFVQANVGRRIGIIDQDRLVGVEGRLGAGHQSTLIRTDVSASTGLHRLGRTRTTLVGQVASTAANALFSDLLATLQKEGSGSVALSWVARGHRADGSSWLIRRSDVVSDRADAEVAAGNAVFGTLDAIASNPFARVTVDRVDIAARGHDALAQRTLTTVRVLRNGVWRLVTPSTVLPVQPGALVRLRATLVAYQHAAPTRVVQLAVRVPADAAGGSGTVQVSGGQDLVSMVDPTGGATTFPGLLANLRAAPTNASVTALLGVPSGDGSSTETVTRTVRLRQAVSGTILLALNVAGGP